MQQERHGQTQADVFMHDLQNINMAEETMHRSRYELAKNFINLNQNIHKMLDCACGTGYGEKILSTSIVKRIDAMDISEEVIRTNIEQNTDKKVRFRIGNITKMDYKNEKFDLITSFETIEHLGLEKSKKAIKEFARVLKPNGYLIISTPNRLITKELHKKYGKNPYHLYEFEPKELIELLKSSGFEIEKCFGQEIYIPGVYRIYNSTGLFDILFKPSLLWPIERCVYFVLVAKRSGCTEEKILKLKKIKTR